MKFLDAQLVFDCKCLLGEGPFWDPETLSLYWIDSLMPTVYKMDESGDVSSFSVSSPIGCLVQTEDGHFVAGTQHGIMHIDANTHECTFVCNPEAHIEGNRFNDGKVDPSGRFWVGSMPTAANEGSANAPKSGKLYCINGDLSHSVEREGLTISNGLAWASDGKTMYHIDSPSLTVMAFDYQSSSSHLSNPRPVIVINEENQIPDGMCIDSQGMLWVAHWGGGKVCQYNPATGECLTTVNVPVVNVTSCAFGGKDLTTLYITTSKIGVSDDDCEKYPHAGGVFKVELDVSGTVSTKFKYNKAK